MPSLYTDAVFQFRIGTNLVTQSGAPSTWREAWPGGEVTVQMVGFDGRAHNSLPARRRATLTATAF